MSLSYASWMKLVFELKAQALTFSYSLTISLTHPKMSWEKFGNIVFHGRVFSAHNLRAGCREGARTLSDMAATWVVFSF